MEEHTSEHGFTRRKNDSAPAHTVDSEVASTSEDHGERQAASSQADAGQQPSADAQQQRSSSNTKSRRKRPAAPQRTQTPTSGTISIERLDAPAATDVYDYDVDRRSEHTEAANTDGIPHRRRRTDPPAVLDRRPARRGRAGWIAATFIFFLLFGSAAALDWYLWDTTQKWEERASTLTDVNYELGERLSSEQQTTLQLSSEIDLLTQQLATSNDKVTALSAQKAGAVDASASYQQDIEVLEDNVDSASSVANALHRCVDGQQELVEYLRDAENYEPEDLESFSSSVRELCDAAEQSNERLQEALNP